MGGEIAVVAEAELRAAVPLDLAAVEAVADAFRALAGGGAVMPPILSMALDGRDGAPGGEVDVKTAYLPGFPSFALKVSTGFFGNAALGLPSLGGLMVVFSARTGVVEAVLLDNGYLTDLRTAAAGAVAARALAPADAAALCVMGTGVQARLQAAAIHLVRPLREVLVWGRDAGKAAACAADISARTAVPARAMGDPAAAVAAADIVVTTTPARRPIFRAAWLRPGLTVIAMGSDMAGKQEIEAQALAAADLLVCDRVSQCAGLGELRAGRAAGFVAADPPELGAVLTGGHPGRTDPAQSVICDLTGTGAQDTAIAAVALARVARAKGG